MRTYPYMLLIQSDGKSIFIHPEIGCLNGGGRIEGEYHKLKYHCTAAALGEAISDTFSHIKKKYENNEEPDFSKKYHAVPWRKRASMSMLQYQDGCMLMLPKYTDHEIMTTSSIAHHWYSAALSVDDIGTAVLDCLQKSFDYAKRNEIAIYYRNNGEMLFVPMAVNRTGYVTADYCVRVENPDSEDEITEAIRAVLAYLAEHPEDARTNKERKNNPPWREHTHYKSQHGFVSHYHCVQLHVLTDGRMEFIPNLRSKVFSSFVPYDELKSVVPASAAPAKIAEELRKSFEVCEWMLQKSEEPDPSCHHDLFFAYVNELRAQRNDIFQTREEWERNRI